MKIFYRFSGIFIVLLLVFVFEGLYVGIKVAENSLNWSNETRKADIDVNLMETLQALLLLGSYMSNFINLFIAPLVIYFVAKNDELMLPIRILIATESAHKFLFSLVYSFYYHCEISETKTMKNVDCSVGTKAFYESVYVFISTHYSVFDVAQICQLFISTSRFFAVSFDGILFSYTLKWPLVQAALPSVLCVIAAEIYLLSPVDSPILNEIFNWIYAIPIFFMIAFDLVTKRRIDELKKQGKVPYAESLLMTQMLANSLLMLITKIVFPIVGILIKSSFELNTLSVFDAFLEFNQYFFFNALIGIIGILCFRKRDDDRRDTLETITGKSAALSFETLRKRRQTI